VIDADFAELVDDHGDASAVVGCQYSVKQRRLAGTEKTGKDGDRHSVIVGIGHALEILP
jgi:hypothetical protein